MASTVHKVDISWDRRPAGVGAHVVFDNARRLNVLGPPALLDLTEAFQSLAREDDLLLGETVLALGNPFGLGGSVSRGILSSKSRVLPKEGEPLDIPNWLQTDAPINLGIKSMGAKVYKKYRVYTKSLV